MNARYLRAGVLTILLQAAARDTAAAQSQEEVNASPIHTVSTPRMA